MDEGWRLTGGFHVSEDQLALSAIRHARVPKSPLRSLVKGRGIFRGPIFSRMPADGPEHGEPYVSAKDLVTSDVEPAAYLSRRHGQLLEDLRLHEGMILVTCSGMNLGKVIWTRPELDGLVASHDLIRIEPNEQAVPPGYLFAFLSGRYGHALIRRQIYGGHIKHIEPDQIAGLPVPRLTESVEATSNDFVQRAALLRDKATAMRRKAIAKVQSLLEWTSAPVTNIATASASSLRRRMDAFHHSSRVVAGRETLANHASSVPLGSKTAEVFEPNRGPRLKVDDSAFGIPFLSSSEVFSLDPVGDYWISRRRTPNLERLQVTDKDLLLPRSGQLGGIIGRAVLPLPTYYGHAASEHLVRVRCRRREDAFFLWSIFASEPGYLATIGTGFGASIPSLDCELLADLRVPWFDSQTRKAISGLIASAIESTSDAIDLERRAVHMVEDALEGKAN